jgi:hypothetical protein
MSRTVTRDLKISYRVHPVDAVLAVYPRSSLVKARRPTADDMLKSRAICTGTIRLHKLFQRASM